jgi:protein-tyrosine phosphatase
MTDSKIVPVDFHAHILPGADHGSTSLETSLCQLKMAREHGIDRIIAAPHFYPTVHSTESFLDRRNKAYEILMSEHNGLPQVRLGAEVLLCNGIERLPGIENLFLAGTNVLLLELPYSDFQIEYCYSIENFVKSGVDVVLAHAERYPSEDIEYAIEYGAKIQINAASMHYFSKRRTIRSWLERGLIVAIGSDIHGTDKHAYPWFVKAAKKLGNFLDGINGYSDKVWSQMN